MTDAEDQTDADADVEAGDAADLDPDAELAGAEAPTAPAIPLEAPAVEYVAEGDTVGQFLARAALSSRDELREYLTESRTDEWLEWLDQEVDVPYVPDQLALRVLDWLVPGPLLSLLDVLVFRRLADATGAAPPDED